MCESKKRRHGEEARMKESLALLLAATGVAWAQTTVLSGVVGGTYQGVSGAPLTVMTESLQTRQGR